MLIPVRAGGFLGEKRQNGLKLLKSSGFPTLLCHFPLLPPPPISSMAQQKTELKKWTLQKKTRSETAIAATHGANFLSRTRSRVSQRETPKNLPLFVRARRKGFFGDSVS